DTNYKAIRCDDINPLTEWIFSNFNTEIPQLVNDISNMNVVLVDHTYSENRADGWERANILEVIDHHDVKLEDIVPQRITIRPCGSTCTLITEKFVNSNIQIPLNIANILLAAILDDSLGLKSPTTIQLDIDMVNVLNMICKVGDIQEYSLEIFKKKDIWHTLATREIIEEDIRNIEINGNWVSISQVETLNSENMDTDSIIKELELMNIEKDFNLRIVMLTNPVERDCILIAVGKDINLLENELAKEIKDNVVYLKDIVSRKKQVLPLIEKIYSV
ncbi:MAG TPA: DHH family phosphoesterase, partial [Candidatus Dojkabacteria bacterium]|nr:DHH family phosphoesterase [Candidatus Dojkabacteria bacterium]